MARRAADPSIGERIKTRRELRGWSMRHAASVSGMAHTTWGRVERGEIRADRYLIADIASALECSVTDLTGQPHAPADRALEMAHARVEPLWRALLETAPDEPPDRPAQPIEALTKRAELLEDRRLACDYAGTGQILPDLLRDLHAATAGPDSRAATVLMVRATNTARGTLMGLGYVKDCALAAERCRQAAEQADAPVPLAVADYSRAFAALAGGSFRRALTVAARAATALERYLTVDMAPEVLGMLHLQSALCVLADKRPADAFTHVAEAEKLAARTGETRSFGDFGPTNVGIWRVGLHVDAGEPGRAVETAARISPTALPSRNRQAQFNIDLARALADVGRDQDSERMLLVAERLAPQHVRSSVAARALARDLLERTKRQSPLYGLCGRLNVAV
jgi:transcriptional regulator with XRE-family HTH domain